MEVSSPVDQSICKKLHFDFLETTSADVQAAVQLSKDNRRKFKLNDINNRTFYWLQQAKILPCQICATPLKGQFSTNG